jgi:hypothetical protein
MKKLKYFLENNYYASIVFSALFGVIFSVLHEGGQKLLLPVIIYSQPFLLNESSSFIAEVIVNCVFQGFIAFGVCLIVVPLFFATLQPKSATYPFVAFGADLLYSFWWLPASIYLNQWPVPVEYMPILFWSSFVTSSIFLGALLRGVRKTNWFNLCLGINCPHCNQKFSFFSLEMNRFGKIKPCPNCTGAVRLSVNLKVAALWIVPVAILALALKPWLGDFNNLLGFVILLLHAAKLEPVE